VKDYDSFAAATGIHVEKPLFSQTPNGPVVNVSWLDAKYFCTWLTEKERLSGKIGCEHVYRLPTDAESSVAVGLPVQTGTTPKQKDGKISNVYPWGTQWPPPQGGGNYDPSLGVDSSSPVGSFAANRYGLFTMGGNVWLWCENLYDGSEPFRG